MSSKEIIHAYRHLYRQGLRAVQFSRPARYVLRDRLRLAFRKTPAASFDSKKIANTVEFLHYATVENGLEHKIVKNLLQVWHVQAEGNAGRPNPKAQGNNEIVIRVTAYDAFNHQIHMLNESMEMCLPAMTVRNP